MEKAAKVYVAVLASFGEDGRLIPRRIRWEDGQLFTIDRVLDVRPSAAQKAGGQGVRYSVQVNGRQSFLFFEHSPEPFGKSLGRWFVERRMEQQD